MQWISISWNAAKRNILFKLQLNINKNVYIKQSVTTISRVQISTDYPSTSIISWESSNMEKVELEMEKVFLSSSIEWHLIHLLTLRNEQTADEIQFIKEYQHSTSLSTPLYTLLSPLISVPVVIFELELKQLLLQTIILARLKIHLFLLQPKEATEGCIHHNGEWIPSMAGMYLFSYIGDITAGSYSKRWINNLIAGFQSQPQAMFLGSLVPVAWLIKSDICISQILQDFSSVLSLIRNRRIGAGVAWNRPIWQANFIYLFI